MRHALHNAMVALAACGTFWGAGPAAAEFRGRSADDVVQVTFLPGWRLADGNHMAGIRIALAPGWKTYWRAPGEGGVPTVLTLTDAIGVRDHVIHWPRPEVFVQNGMRSIGYGDVVVLPVEFTLTEPDAIPFTGQVELGVCLDVCIPIALELTGQLPTATTRVPEIAQALSNRPLTATEAGAGAARCRVTPISDGLQVDITLALPTTGAEETVVLEHRDSRIWVSETINHRDGGTVYATADVVPPHSGPFALNRSDLRITVIGTGMAVEVDGCTG
jgi:DsbC/DsbD-like thiol-disulfide interchange protein